MMQNPNVTAAMYGIDVSFLNVKVAEGALFPTVNLVASIQQSYESTLVAAEDRSTPRSQRRSRSRSIRAARSTR